MFLLVNIPAEELEATHALAVAEGLRLAVGKFKRRMREQTEIGSLTWSKVAVLSRLDREGPATVSALAKGEAMRPQSMGAIVSELETAHLIVGNPDPKDGRQTIVRLTEAGRQTLQIGRASGNDWLSRSLQTKLSSQERETLAAAVDLINRLVDTPNP